ncbi:MAG: ECF transporter S component [Negativicutes bacterium]|nr:ECF transporter S component [Negativicutes bacterium]
MNSTFSLQKKVATAMMITLTIILATTPLGTIRLPLVSVTIAHAPVLITTILLGLYPGLWVALSFGLLSLFLAITTPTSLMSPFFMNPLVSIFPRILIPVTAYFAYKISCKIFTSKKKKEIISIGISIIVGNLTNTFGVYLMIYLIYAQEILEKTGKSAISLILVAMSTSTAIKCLFLVLVLVPLIKILQKRLRY